MNRLSINEIKNDIKSGYAYMDYGVRYYMGQMTIILDKHSENVIISFSRNGYIVTYAIQFEQFVKMSRKDFDKRFANELYYNAVQYDI